MNNGQDAKEEQSLLEVRKWKEECRQETDHLTPEEYIQWIRATSEELLAKHHLKLEGVHR
jgi:hypothetical protein